MAYPILIIGRSGMGKSTSLRNLDPDKTALINVLGKPLPFRGKFDQIVTADYAKIMNAISKTNRPIVVIDDAGYLMTSAFMSGHASQGSGNALYSFYNTLGDNFWFLIEHIRSLPTNQRVYLIMHEDGNESYDIIKPKTIGKMLDEKVCIEGMFSICLRCVYSNGRHVFRTRTNGKDTAKTPLGMFEEEEIDNDLKVVDEKIKEFYVIQEETK